MASPGSRVGMAGLRGDTDQHQMASRFGVNRQALRHHNCADALDNHTEASYRVALAAFIKNMRIS
jgi:hypothetical protein